ncbi:MAG TPA: hypothetical protein DF427_08730 [Moraxellaceae bacterium]|nr:hypothetical protein [Moraxellaceae bacterium]
MIGNYQKTLQKLDRYFEARGQNFPLALQAAGILLPDPAHSPRLAPALTYRIWSLAEQLSGDPVLGCSLLAHSRINDFGSVAALAAMGGSLLQALTRTSRFSRLLTNASHFDVEETKGRIIITIHPHKDSHWRAIEYLLALLMALIAFRLSPGLKPVSLSVAFNNPDVQEYYECFFGCQVTQGAKLTQLVLPYDNAIQTPGDAEIADFFEKLMEPELQALETEGWSTAVTRIIRAQLGSEEPTLGSAACILNVSARTLQRNLSEEGVTFQQVMDEARRHMAVDWLRNNVRSLRPRPLGELAHELGFASSSNLTRAFKRWFGKTPGQLVRDGLGA